MQTQQKSFSDKFIEIIKDNVDKNIFNAEKMNDMENGLRLVDKKTNHSDCLIFKTTFYDPKEHDFVVLLCNANAVFFDAENIKDINIVNQIDKLTSLNNKNEFKKLFKKTVEEYERKRKYAGISNETIEKIKYGSISSDDFDKEKNNQEASFFF
ncbi:MAG: hypothetical protein IJT14_01470 [Rickettsiales bacterium]|nr:hypothetical protein [Rickettsiales bacterium]